MSQATTTPQHHSMHLTDFCTRIIMPMKILFIYTYIDVCFHVFMLECIHSSDEWMHSSITSISNITMNKHMWGAVLAASHASKICKRLYCCVTHFHFPAAFCCGCNLKSIDYNVAMTFILNNNNNNNKFTVGHETVCWVTMVKVSVQELANTGTSLIGLQLLLSNSFRAVLVPFIQRVEMFCSWDDWNSFCCFTHGVVDSDVCELAMHSTHVLYSTVNNCKLDMLQTELLKHL